MKATWLGQSGLMLETCGRLILIDPYLSDSVSSLDPRKVRRVPVEERFLRLAPDVIVCTHAHVDHSDPETLRHYLTGEGRVTVLAPAAAFEEVRKFGGNHEYVLFNRHTQFTLPAAPGKDAVRFTAVKAEHSDPHPIGVIVEAEGRRLYITGDTLYNTEIFGDIPERIDVLFLPVNGTGNNMNMADAARFCARIKPALAVPTHCGLYDDIDMNALAYEPKAVPQIYQEIKL